MDGVSGVSSGATASSQSATKLNQDFDQFLALLTTQLQNQDPLSPMDSSEFTNQLVQFSSVEQQIKSNQYLENLLQMQTLNLTALGLSFIGKDIETEGKNFNADGTKPVNLSYVLPQAAASGTVSILDKDGNVVYSQPIETAEGLHSFTWDGKDQNGMPVAPGKYELRIGALTATNTSINVTTYVPGHVSGLESADDGTLLLNVDGEKVPLTSVRKIFEALAGL